MWGRKKHPRVTDEVLDLDEQIRALRGVISTDGGTRAVGPLINLLTARATLAGMQDRDDAVLEDRRAAAGLLRGYDGQPSPLHRKADLLVRMTLVAAERTAGNLDQAIDAAGWAMEHVGAVGPDDTEYCEAFVADLDQLRADLSTAKRHPEALRAAQLATDMATRLAEQDETAYLTMVGTAWLNEASARANAGDFDRAGTLNEEAIALLEEHAPTSPALTTALSNRAALQRRDGRWTEAVTTEKQLLAGLRADQPTPREEIARLNSLFLTLVRSGRREEAEQTVTEAIAVAHGAMAVDPTQAFALAQLLGNQANIRGELGRYDDALVSSEEALALREQMVLADPSPAHDEGLAMVLNNHSAVLRKLGRYAEAAAAASRSVELRRRNVDPDDPNSVALLANSLNSHAEHLGLLGEGEQAVALATEAQGLFAGLPEPGARKPFLRANQETLGTALAVAGRYDEAVEAARRAVELGRQAAADVPGEIPELASCLESFADRLDQLGRSPEAEAARAEASQLRAATAS
jgi:tetratricopeptide (TPR) repeat protein